MYILCVKELHWIKCIHTTLIIIVEYICLRFALTHLHTLTILYLKHESTISPVTGSFNVGLASKKILKRKMRRIYYAVISVVR